MIVYFNDKGRENSQWLFCYKYQVLLSKHGLLKAESLRSLHSKQQKNNWN